jgi:integrase
MLNVAVRKKLLQANPCWGVEFPVAVRGLFRPHYVTWSEQRRIESQAPPHLRNIVQIITETGLRVYKELTPMRKDQVDLVNATVWIPDSKTPDGIAEIPLTPLATDAFKSQMMISGDGPFLFPSAKNRPVITRTSRPRGGKRSNAQEFLISGSMTCAPLTQLDSVPVVSPTSGLPNSSGRAMPKSSKSILK